MYEIICMCWERSKGRRQEEGGEMHIWIVDLPKFNDFPSLSAQSPCTHHRAEHAIDMCTCFSSLDLSKPAGIPGNDISRRQDVAKEGTRHC